MRYIIILILTNLSVFLNAQDSLFQTLLQKSHSVVVATVVSTSGKVRHEDGYLHYTVLFKVTQYFKGESSVGDSLYVEITDNSQKLSGRDSATQEEKLNVIQMGASLVLCLVESEHQKDDHYTIYRPTDRMLGVLTSAPSLILYLESNFKPERK